MSGSTSVPAISFTDRGFVGPAESAIVTGLDADYTAAFGGVLNTDPAEPAGQLITSTAAMLGDTYDQECLLFNSVDPAFASGRMQDAIARIYFLTRNPAQSTVLEIACGGARGVPIPVGASVKDDSGNIYFCTQAGVIPAGGSITLSFASAVMAPVPVPPSVTIYQIIPQWDTAAVSSGVVGNLTESRSAFESRREASVAANGAGFLPAIGGNLSKVPGIIDWYVTENDTGSPATIGGVTVAANSLYVAAFGGAAADIALAIWTKKNPGCAYNGSTTFDVYDTNSGYSPPFPGPYTVAWTTPTVEPTAFTVRITNSAAVPANAAALINAAIASAFVGGDGGFRARIGSTIYASRYYAAVALLGSWAQVISIKVGTNASPAASTTGAIAGTALTVSSGTGIAAGQVVFGAAVLPGTFIVSGSSTSWVVSIGQTVGSEAMTFVASTSDDVTMQINQIPTFAAGNANVVLV